MKKIAQFVSVVALVGTVAPSVLFFYDSIDLPTVKTWMIPATLLWFLSATLWMEHKIGS